MGKPKEAAIEQAMFVEKKVDPGAPTYSLNFLRLHPEISNESVPWHMHSDLQTEGGAPAMASRLTESHRFLRVVGQLAIALCIFGIPNSAHARNNCPWINEHSRSKIANLNRVGTGLRQLVLSAMN